MKNGRQTMPLAEVCEIKPPKSEARERVAANALVSFAPMEDLGIDQKFLNATQVKPLASVVGSYTYFADGDVLLAKITPCFENGKLGIARGLSNGIGFGSSEFIVFRPTASLDKEFLYYFLARPEFRSEGAARMGGAVGQQRVPKEFIESYPIPVPPLPEQQRVVGILDEAFDGIATAKAYAEKNLQNARALFESHLQSVFTRRGKGWVEKKLADVCDFQGGSQPPKSKFVYEPRAGYVRFLQIRDFKSDKHITYIPQSSKNRLCKSEDILIARYGASVGQILAGKAGSYNVALIKTIPDSRSVDRNFFCLYLRSELFQKPLMSVADRSAQNGFSKDDIAQFPVPLPPREKQERIVAGIDTLSTETQRLASLYERKLAALEALKKSLLHQAFSGEL
jgi:type I restriction enzyme S subunit